jgi:hypothetical protein
VPANVLGGRCCAVAGKLIFSSNAWYLGSNTTGAAESSYGFSRFLASSILGAASFCGHPIYIGFFDFTSSPNCRHRAFFPCHLLFKNRVQVRNLRSQDRTLGMAMPHSQINCQKCVAKLFIVNLTPNLYLQLSAGSIRLPAERRPAGRRSVAAQAQPYPSRFTYVRRLKKTTHWDWYGNKQRWPGGERSSGSGGWYSCRDWQPTLAGPSRIYFGNEIAATCQGRARWLARTVRRTGQEAILSPTASTAMGG